MSTQLTTISINKLSAHPDNPNQMSKADFAKLLRHIERTSRYEPLIVRPKTPDPRPKTPDNTQYAARRTRYEIINGHHRLEALKQLGFQKCDCIVWDVDDDETALLLATLNRLSGNDVLDKKLALLKKLNAKRSVEQLSKMLPNTKTQIAKLIELQKTKLLWHGHLARDEHGQGGHATIAYPFVFFLNAEQKTIVEKALSLAMPAKSKLTKAKRNACAITKIAREFLIPGTCHSERSVAK